VVLCALAADGDETVGGDDHPRGIPNAAPHKETVSEQVSDRPRMVSDRTGTPNQAEKSDQNLRRPPMTVKRWVECCREVVQGVGEGRAQHHPSFLRLHHGPSQAFTGGVYHGDAPHPPASSQEDPTSEPGTGPSSRARRAADLGHGRDGKSDGRGPRGRPVDPPGRRREATALPATEPSLAPQQARPHYGLHSAESVGWRGDYPREAA